jgi:hypothetical protein
MLFPAILKRIIQTGSLRLIDRETFEREHLKRLRW